MPGSLSSKFVAAVFISISICAGIATFNSQSLGSTASPDKSEAQHAMDRADELRASWTKASLQQAIEHYGKAALLWTAASDFINASKATLNAADVYFLFSDYQEALKRYQEAEKLAEKAGDWLSRANALSRMGRLQSFIGDNELALQQSTKALELFKQHEADRSDLVNIARGEALGNLAEVNYSKGDLTKARELFKTAVDLVKADPTKAAKIHIFNGYIAGSLGDTARAKEEIAQAQTLYREANDKVGEALALTAEGLVYTDRSEQDRAIELHNRAIQIFHAAGSRHSEAIALNAKGQSYERLSEYELALDNYQQALRLFDEIGSKEGVAAAAFQIGAVHQMNKRVDQALVFYERALHLSRAAGKVRSEITILSYLAGLNAAQGSRELALSQYQKALSLYESNDLRGQATALNAYAEFLLRIKENEKALEACLEALPLSERVDEKGLLTTTLYNLARAQLAVGSTDVALSTIRRSLEMIEDLRANVASPDFRLSYLSGVGKHYELCIEILTQLDRQHPGQSFATEALLLSERGRARLLLDLIRESRSRAREGASQEFLDRERELQGLFRAQAQYRMELSLSRKDSAEIADIDYQLVQLKAEYQAVQAKISEQNPRLFSSEKTAPLSLQQIQNELRDGGTMLLEYSLGDERSHLWAVTSNSIEYHDLPARKEIEDAARELYGLTIARQASLDSSYQANVDAADNAYQEKAKFLSQILLGPVAERLGNKRLLVVTEGALQHISIEALPLPVTKTSPSAAGTYVIENNEIVILPSFSTLVAIRNSQNRPSSPNKLVAVIADPVFSNTDERVKSEPGTRGVALAAGDQKSDPQTRDGGLARLAYASEEADAISAVAPWGTTMVAKGFDANRELAMSADVAQFQIVHFATHGFLDSEHPELSGIVLSSLDHGGQVKDGLMPLHDIYSLDLSAQLTVLSACQTALGKDIKGEGLVGLTHSFISAGSNSVVASLWKVDDRATAVLMADFYDSMLQQGMTPAAALRSAKLKLMKDGRWRVPYYWAGFVLQGEYTNHISVTRHSWLRSGLMLSVLLVLVAAALFVFKKRRGRSLPSPSN